MQETFLVSYSVYRRTASDWRVAVLKDRLVPSCSTNVGIKLSPMTRLLHVPNLHTSHAHQECNHLAPVQRVKFPSIPSVVSLPSDVKVKM